MNDDSGDVRKSVGIDKEGGLVFALDTMQVVVLFIGRSLLMLSPFQEKIFMKAKLLRRSQSLKFH